MQNSIRRIENLHIGFWLLKDLGWVQNIHILGISMLIPTLLMALWLTWRMRHDFAELTHNIAVCCWIVANGIWMIGEFFYNDGTRLLATVFFLAGVGALAVFYAARIVARVKVWQNA